MKRISAYLSAKLRAFAPLSCLRTPRPDVLQGMGKWRWLYRRRRSGALVDPGTEIRSENLDLDSLEENICLEKGATIDKGCILWIGTEDGRTGELVLKEGAYIGPYSFLGTCHRLVIGKRVMIGANSYLITVNHRTSNEALPFMEQGYEGSEICIGDNVWLGCHVVVLPGVTIGDNAVIGAGAVVTKDVPVGETWAGIPARKIR